MKLNLAREVADLIKKIETTEGTTTGGAVRDLLTEVAHFCEERGLDVTERLVAAVEVAAEERKP